MELPIFFLTKVPRVLLLQKIYIHQVILLPHAMASLQTQWHEIFCKCKKLLVIMVMVHVPFLAKQIKVEPLDNGLNNEEIAAAMASPHGCSVAADAPLAPRPAQVSVLKYLKKRLYIYIYNKYFHEGLK